MLLLAEGGTVLFSTEAGVGSFISRKATVLDFPEDSSMSINSDLENIFEDDPDALMKTVAEMLLTAYLKVSDLQAE